MKDKKLTSLFLGRILEAAYRLALRIFLLVAPRFSYNML